MAVDADIRALILEGELVPGQRLIESELVERFGASRAAVRDAFGRLEGEGLVERVQNRGARVRVIPFDEAIEITEVRRALESLCAGKAAERVTDDEIAELRGIAAQMKDAAGSGDVGEYGLLNRRLHACIHEISGQGTARALIARLRGQIVRHQYRLAMKPGRPAKSVEEHIAIVDAICARDRVAAEAAMAAHIDSVLAAMRQTNRAATEEAAAAL
ncbi:GntR family transcriptional regulator [Myceligenerans pegani]|uniref:GntR family transcriptional regulator n=1 Tax=Myceligenerans pegani TaxID=2776917 RepID=A0ABR9N5W8_9MICO|nr:GntR family transcriptional regulator [Myceligenerans sp. TRM 65318]MBE1879043.1 GntR family transcriptional regulator [Myceligenerans sp. TRM 65318]MBE3021314.1 GntR family transcriptional regulator [Myceligenerans sp. TRM 65318]